MVVKYLEGQTKYMCNSRAPHGESLFVGASNASLYFLYKVVHYRDWLMPVGEVCSVVRCLLEQERKRPRQAWKFKVYHSARFYGGIIKSKWIWGVTSRYLLLSQGMEYGIQLKPPEDKHRAPMSTQNTGCESNLVGSINWVCEQSNRFSVVSDSFR